MGHIGRLKGEYRDLVDRLQSGPVAFPEPRDPGAWEGWREILEILYTPEEAAVAARMPVKPMSLERLSARLGIPAARLRPQLDAMADKGLVMDLVHGRSGRTAWLLSPPVVGFFEYSLMRAKDSIPKKRMAEALHAYTHGDSAFSSDAFGGDTTIGRALVHETALADDPLPDVLDWQRASEVVGDARSWAVSLCFCRHKAEHLGQACERAAGDLPVAQWRRRLRGPAEVRTGHRAPGGARHPLCVACCRVGADCRQREEPPNLRLQLLRLLLRAAPGGEPLGARRRQPERLRAQARRARVQRLLPLRQGLPRGGHRDGAGAAARQAAERARSGHRR